MATKKKALQAAAGNAGAGLLAIEDVFSTYLYAGNGSTQTITNGIDLAGEGGMVWSKPRDTTQFHGIIDTERGVSNILITNTTAAESFISGAGVTAFNSNGYNIGFGGAWNLSGYNYASWTFRKAPRWFDCVTYTGTGANQTIPHNLGCEVGSIFVKRTDSAANWAVQHRSTTNVDGLLYLNLTNAEANGFGTVWNGRATSTDFTVGTSTAANTSGATYVAYLFAHDPLGPSGDGSDGLIACGSYTGNGNTSGTNEINLGWEPQTLIIKRSNSAEDWIMTDVMMGIPTSPYGTYDRHILKPNTSDAEYGSVDYFNVTPTGFRLTTNNSQINASGGNYIYIAIRRGPMRAPESGTEVFAVDTNNSSKPGYTSNFPVDMAFYKNVSGGENVTSARLIQGKDLKFDSTDAEGTNSNATFDFMDGWNGYTGGISSLYSWMFRRAPGFFDVVAYTGNYTAGHNISHNLGVAPEMMWVKKRNAASFWRCYHKDLGNTKALALNDSGVAGTSTYWSNTTPTENVFTVGVDGGTNSSGDNFIAYLFATLPGVSKVGSYTGNGTSQTIDCGFTSGARFVLIKRTDASSNWKVMDTARGIVAGDDKVLELDNTAAETTFDLIDPDNSGFIVEGNTTQGMNQSGASYIFYAIA